MVSWLSGWSVASIRVLICGGSMQSLLEEVVFAA
jgi:hypothetical protein